MSLTRLIMISIINIPPMILCLCHGVSDRVVRLAVVNGADSVAAVGSRCAAGTDCGACKHAIQDIVDDMHLESQMCAEMQAQLGGGDGVCQGGHEDGMGDSSGSMVAAGA